MTWHRTTVTARFMAKVDAALGSCAHCTRNRPAGEPQALCHQASTLRAVDV